VFWVLYEMSYYWERWSHWQDDLLLDSYKKDEMVTLIDDNDNFGNAIFVSRSCQQKEKNIAFVKTHKTGSSTITSIIDRFADINNLEVAIPKVGDNRFRWPYSFKIKFVDRTRLQTRLASIICNHLVFDRQEISKIMKRPYKLITILRDPVYQFRSLFYYHRMHKYYNISNTSNSIELFFKNKTKLYGKSNNDVFIRDSEILMQNGMSFDLHFGGFQKNSFNNSFGDFLEYIDQSFHLVLITELFDESLILLKRLMCWKFIDIVYHKKLVNLSLKKSKDVSLSVKEEIYKWNRFDVQLYTHFKDKLVNTINQQNKTEFQEELKNFRALNTAIYQLCKEKSTEKFNEVISLLTVLKEFDKKEEIYLRPHCFCVKSTRSEIKYLSYFKRKYPKFHFHNKLQYNSGEKNGC